MQLGAPKVSLFALLSSAALAIVLAAQVSLRCTDKVALPIPGEMMGAMPGMDMSGMQGPSGQTALMICPIVLGLIVASTALALAAVAMVWRDPHRALAQRAIALALCRRLYLVLAARSEALAGCGDSVCPARAWPAFRAPAYRCRCGPRLQALPFSVR